MKRWTDMDTPSINMSLCVFCFNCFNSIRQAALLFFMFLLWNLKQGFHLPTWTRDGEDPLQERAVEKPANIHVIANKAGDKGQGTLHKDARS